VISAAISGTLKIKSFKVFFASFRWLYQCSRTADNITEYGRFLSRERHTIVVKAQS